MAHEQGDALRGVTEQRLTGRPTRDLAVDCERASDLAESTSRGATPSLPIATPAADVLSAITSANVNLNASYRESITSIPPTTRSVAVSTSSAMHDSPDRS